MVALVRAASSLSLLLQFHPTNPQCSASSDYFALFVCRLLPCLSPPLRVRPPARSVERELYFAIIRLLLNLSAVGIDNMQLDVFGVRADSTLTQERPS